MILHLTNRRNIVTASSTATFAIDSNVPTEVASVQDLPADCHEPHLPSNRLAALLGVHHQREAG